MPILPLLLSLLVSVLPPRQLTPLLHQSSIGRVLRRTPIHTITSKLGLPQNCFPFLVSSKFTPIQQFLDPWHNNLCGAGVVRRVCVDLVAVCVLEEICGGRGCCDEA
ncbi:hypothetical protein Droror1_Dr00027126 [Drosera rotundifolia]